MSRYTGPKLRLVRRLGTLPGLTSKVPKKTTRPGQHGAAPKKKSEYAIALEEKQKIRFNYGLSERQLRRYMDIASKKSKSLKWDALLKLCEMRLDNIVFRLGFAPSIPAARQLVRHGHISVNQKAVNIPSFQCAPGHQIVPKDKAGLALVQRHLEKHQREALPEHLNSNLEAIQGTVLNDCAPENVLLKVNARLVVEYYNQ